MSMEREEGVGVGVNGCLNKTLLFLVNAKPMNSASFPECLKEKQDLENQRCFVIHLIHYLNAWPLPFRAFNLLMV